MRKNPRTKQWEGLGWKEWEKETTIYKIYQIDQLVNEILMEFEPIFLPVIRFLMKINKFIAS